MCVASDTNWVELRNVAFLLLSLICIKAQAQKISFKNKQVDTIKISSTHGSYLFDDEGTSWGRKDILLITFDSSKSVYHTSSYQIEKSVYRFNPKPNHDSIELKTTIAKKYSNSKLCCSILTGLLNSLQENNKLHYSLSHREFKNVINYKRIKNIAKLYNADWNFRRKYIIKREKDSIINGCRNLDTFNIYLSELSDTSSLGMTLVTDVHSGFEIELILDIHNKILFETQYPDIWGIPWYYDTDINPWQHKYVLNNNINDYLFQLLPDKFLNKKNISFQRLIDFYIKWYLQRRDIILSP